MSDTTDKISPERLREMADLLLSAGDAIGKPNLYTDAASALLQAESDARRLAAIDRPLAGDELRDEVESYGENEEVPAETRIGRLIDIVQVAEVALSAWPDRCSCDACGAGIVDHHKAAKHPTLYWGRLCPACAEKMGVDVQ